MDIISSLMMVTFAIKPFVIMYLNIVFKGESDLKEKENMQLKQQLAYSRETAEYRVVLAAREGRVENGLVATKDWNDTNEKIGDLE